MRVCLCLCGQVSKQVGDSGGKGIPGLVEVCEGCVYAVCGWWCLRVSCRLRTVHSAQTPTAQPLGPSEPYPSIFGSAARPRDGILAIHRGHAIAARARTLLDAMSKGWTCKVRHAAFAASQAVHV